MKHISFERRWREDRQVHQKRLSVFFRTYLLLFYVSERTKIQKGKMYSRRMIFLLLLVHFVYSFDESEEESGSGSKFWNIVVFLTRNLSGYIQTFLHFTKLTWVKNYGMMVWKIWIWLFIKSTNQNARKTDRSNNYLQVFEEVFNQLIWFQLESSLLMGSHLSRTLIKILNEILCFDFSTK